jgi:hypothetical protein
VRKKELEMFRFERGLLGLSAIAILACLFVTSGGFAQTGTTSLRGTILDNSGAVITGATVTLTNSQQGFERTVVTEDTGTYEFLGLTPGVYSLRVEKENFRRHEINKIELQVNTPKTENVTLDIGSSTQTVEVAASTQVLNTTDASLGTAFNENQIKQLPLDGRNVPDLLTLQAGVVYTGNRSDINKNTDTRSGAVNGSRSDQSNITLDGVDVNDQVNGYAFTSVLPVSVDSVQEFRVTTSSYNADQGRFGSAGFAGHKKRHKQLARLAVRVSPQHAHERERLLCKKGRTRSRRSQCGSQIDPKCFRSFGRGPHQERPSVLFPQLRRLPSGRGRLRAANRPERHASPGDRALSVCYTISMPRWTDSRHQLHGTGGI